MKTFPLLLLPLLALAGACRAGAEDPPPRLEFTRMIAHWANYADPEYLPFVDEAEPELAQLGFYGGHYWSLSHTPQFGGYPAHFPVQGLSECGQWFEDRNAEMRKRNVKVIGHFNVEFLVGEPDGPDGPRGFFKFYRELWDENELGPKPVDDPLELLETNAAGEPIVNQSYSIGGMHEYWACLRNPHWQQVLKAWVKRAVERGVDGLIANYFYRHNCLCEHCQRGFRQYLADRFTAQQLAERFAIDDVSRHQFDELVCWHDPKESSPLRLEMLRWSQVSNKQVFDDVLVRYGRSLKPDLIVAQWNHLSNFSQINGDERCLLPAELWGRDEDYLWYSTGSAAFYTDLKEGFLGEGTLQARYIRGAFDDKPFTLGKYESTRIRVAIAELAANGGAPMGFYTRFTDPEARREIVRYYQFLKRHDALFRANQSHAEVVLLYPRSAVHRGDIGPVEMFRQLGKKLLDAHVLFDVLPDDLADEQALARYAHVVSTDSNDDLPTSAASELSRFVGPTTVRVSASRPNQNSEITLHFVNYDRTEPPRGRDGKPSAGRGIAEERPIAATGLKADFVLPQRTKVVSVELSSPEQPESRAVAFEQTGGRLKFDVPEVFVYTIARIRVAAE